MLMRREQAPRGLVGRPMAGATEAGLATVVVVPLTSEEVKRIERQIKRAILDQPFGSKALVAAVTQRFMELGKRHFR